MENKIYKVSSIDIIKIKEEFKRDITMYIADFDGNRVQNKEDFVKIMNETYKYPRQLTLKCACLDAFSDWMRDLDWLKKEKYVLIIYNYNEFLKHDTKLKTLIISIFEEDILPWWEKEVERCVVEGKAKPFNVYLVD